MIKNESTISIVIYKNVISSRKFTISNIFATLKNTFDFKTISEGELYAFQNHVNSRMMEQRNKSRTDFHTSL